MNQNDLPSIKVAHKPFKIMNFLRNHRRAITIAVCSILFILGIGSFFTSYYVVFKMPYAMPHPHFKLTWTTSPGAFSVHKNDPRVAQPAMAKEAASDTTQIAENTDTTAASDSTSQK